MALGRRRSSRQRIRGARRADASPLTLRSPPAAAVADYSFMLPASTAVATCCQLCGIGGAALFSPIFLLAFTAAGPRLPTGLGRRGRGVRAADGDVRWILRFWAPIGLRAAGSGTTLVKAVARRSSPSPSPGCYVGAVCAPALAGGSATPARRLRAADAVAGDGPRAAGSRGAPPGDKLTDGTATAGGATFLTGLLGVDGVGTGTCRRNSRATGRYLGPRGTSVAVVAGTAAATPP